MYNPLALYWFVLMEIHQRVKWCLSVCLTKYHSVKIYWDSWGITSWFLNLWHYMEVTEQYTPQDTYPWCPLVRRLCKVESWSAVCRLQLILDEGLILQTLLPIKMAQLWDGEAVYLDLALYLYFFSYFLCVWNVCYFLDWWDWNFFTDYYTAGEIKCGTGSLQEKESVNWTVCGSKEWNAWMVWKAVTFTKAFSTRIRCPSKCHSYPPQSIWNETRTRGWCKQSLCNQGQRLISVVIKTLNLV